MKKMRFVAAVVFTFCMVALFSKEALAAGRTVTNQTKQESAGNVRSAGRKNAGKADTQNTEKKTGKNRTDKNSNVKKQNGNKSVKKTEGKQTLFEKLGALVKKDVSYSAKANHFVGKTIKGKVKRYTEGELRYMTCIIYCEARGECYAGKKAVGIVVMNRVKDERFPDSIQDVIYQSGQFTPARSGSLSSALAMYDRQEKTGKVKGTMKKCMKAAKSALAGSTTVQVGGQKKEMKDYLFFSRYIPNAAYSIGAHQFK